MSQPIIIDPIKINNPVNKQFLIDQERAGVRFEACDDEEELVEMCFGQRLPSDEEIEEMKRQNREADRIKKEMEKKQRSWWYKTLKFLRVIK